MGKHRDHDPLERLNEHHGDDLLAIARTFGGYPDAVSAQAEGMGVEGVDITVETAQGQARAHVAFSDAVRESGPGGVRVAFTRLARQARARLAATDDVSSPRGTRCRS
jgi:hypothetical protein